MAHGTIVDGVLVEIIILIIRRLFWLDDLTMLVHWTLIAMSFSPVPDLVRLRNIRDRCVLLVVHWFVQIVIVLLQHTFWVLLSLGFHIWLLIVVSLRVLTSWAASGALVFLVFTPLKDCCLIAIVAFIHLYLFIIWILRVLALRFVISFPMRTKNCIGSCLEVLILVALLVDLVVDFTMMPSENWLELIQALIHDFALDIALLCWQHLLPILVWLLITACLAIIGLLLAFLSFLKCLRILTDLRFQIHSLHALQA